MDYPADFPRHLQPPVDAAIHKAEAEYLEARKKDGQLFGAKWQAFALDRIKTIFFVFGEQACEAGRQNLWSGEIIRTRLATYLNTVATAVYLSTCPVIFRAVTSQGDRRSIDILIGAIHGSGEWIELQRKLRAVAESRSTRGEPPPPAETDKSTEVSVEEDLKPREAAPDHMGPFSNRAVWLQKQLDERSTKSRIWDKNWLEEQGGPDHKTTQKILDGQRVTGKPLRKLVLALNAHKILNKAKFSDIPND